MTMMQAYLLTRLDGICGLFIFLSVLSAIAGGTSLIFAWVEKWEYRVIYTKILVTLLIIFTTINVLVPTTKEMAFIILFPKITNSKFIQEIPDDMMEIKNLAMEYIKENLSNKKPQ